MKTFNIHDGQPNPNSQQLAIVPFEIKGTRVLRRIPHACHLQLEGGAAQLLLVRSASGQHTTTRGGPSLKSCRLVGTLTRRELGTGPKCLVG